MARTLFTTGAYLLQASALCHLNENEIVPSSSGWAGSCLMTRAPPLGTSPDGRGRICGGETRRERKWSCRGRRSPARAWRDCRIRRAPDPPRSLSRSSTSQPGGSPWSQNAEQPAPVPAAGGLLPPREAHDRPEREMLRRHRYDERIGGDERLMPSRERFVGSREMLVALQRWSRVLSASRAPSTSSGRDPCWHSRLP